MLRTLLLIFLSMIFSGSVCAFDFRHDAIVTGNLLRLRDVAALDDLPDFIRMRVRDLVIARVSKESHQATIGFATLRAAARRRAPVLSRYTNDAQEGELRLTIGRAEDVSNRPSLEISCSLIVDGVDKGQAIGAGDVKPVPCPAKINRGVVRYDTWARTTYAARRLARGEIIAAVRPDPSGFVAGQTVLIRGQAGAVQVQRQVRALRSGQYGKPIAVAAASGAAFSAAPVTLGAPL